MMTVFCTIRWFHEIRTSFDKKSSELSSSVYVVEDFVIVLSEMSPRYIGRNRVINHRVLQWWRVEAYLYHYRH